MEGGGAITVLGWAHLALFGLLVPLGALKSRGALRDTELGLTPRALALSALVQVTLLGLVSIGVALAQDVDFLAVGRIGGAPVAAAAVGWLVLLAYSASRTVRRVRQGDRSLVPLLPRTPRDRALWGVLSVAAGVLEEITWRSVQWELLTLLVGDRAWAAVLCAAMFALSHLAQGWSGAAVSFAFALGLHGLVAWTDGLALAMGVHFAYDLLAVLTSSRIAERMGYFGPAEA